RGRQAARQRPRGPARGPRRCAPSRRGRRRTPSGGRWCRCCRGCARSRAARGRDNRRRVARPPARRAGPPSARPGTSRDPPACAASPAPRRPPPSDADRRRCAPTRTAPAREAWRARSHRAFSDRRTRARAPSTRHPAPAATPDRSAGARMARPARSCPRPRGARCATARPTIYRPRSRPSTPTLAISTRTGGAMAANCTVLPSAHPMTSDPGFFRDLAWVIVAAVAGGALAWLARQPLILGYVVGGILVGRFTPGPTVSDIHTFELFAEIGVVLLMFSVGIEFSLRDLLR